LAHERQGVATMPDRDVVRSGVSRFFQRSYRQLCEGVLPKEELVHSTLEALTRSVCSYGDEPIRYLQAVGVQVAELPDEPLFRATIDWCEQDRLVYEKAQRIFSEKHAVGLAVRRAILLIQELSRGNAKLDVQARLLRGYLSDIYEADFVGRVLLATGDSAVDRHILEDRINSIRADVNDGIDKLVEQLTEKGTVTAIRTPRRSNQRERITLDTDLLKPSGLDGKDA
jgi:hypothetical protein